MAKEKAVLAYSGGLDTSVILTYLKENYNYDVIAVCVNVGQEEDFDAVEKKAYATGASKAYIVDVTEELVTDYIWPTLKAGAIYENDYLLGTSFARPLIAKELVRIAHEEGAVAIAHGCTGKGNDQVRFESSIHALDPSLKIVAPWREWDLKSREDCIAYAQAHNIPISQTLKKIYSRDQNIWHISHEGGNLENPWNEHLDDIHVMSVPAEQAPDKPTFVEITFDKGCPVALDGKDMNPVELLETLNKLGERKRCRHDRHHRKPSGRDEVQRCLRNAGRHDPLRGAPPDLEKLISDWRHDAASRNQRFSRSLHSWSTTVSGSLLCARCNWPPLWTRRRMLVTGVVKMKLYKGSAWFLWPVQVSSIPCSMKSSRLSAQTRFTIRAHAEGFINLFSLPLKDPCHQLQGKQYSFQILRNMDMSQYEK